MPFVTGDVIPSGDPEWPFKVVFKRGDEIVSEWYVDTQESGEEQILTVLQRAAEEDDDEEEDEDEG
ncbi:hypothetical protein [Hyphomicrobium sp.]|uniref:hypothetical protein n=1 Tax=Hyphomicrobium sp. TaxID=82 RepID=UPI002E36C098|nr:hypothetical protein [Hyphomicrobium sp.]HEX2842140.1 hypothetical protein [Hyphomicrobium sp.]